jgi:transcriptional regulator with XRE-family HTH domain
MRVSEKIKIAMKEAGLTQTALAKKLGVKHPTIGTWVNGRRNPKITSLKKIADETGKPMSFFLENSNSGDGARRSSYGRNPSSIDMRLKLIEQQIENLNLRIQLLEKAK